jgi:uncharacterized Zn finger protein
MSWWRDRYGQYPRYQPSRPREARGGIKARSKRGDFGESWWAKRWTAVLEGFQIGARLARGRKYARQGQVLAIQIEKGQVRAKVQGSRPTPYEIAIQVKLIASDDWQRLAQALARQALFAAKLLAGEMPQDIEDVFRAEKLSLFPERLGDLSTKCSCPDWSNPCKHIAAVYYLLGEEFDRDPFLLFTLRGLTREELLETLEGAGGARKAATRSEPQEVLDDTEPIATDPGVFWHGGELPDDFFGEVQAPPVAAALPRRLGGFPFWRGDEPFLKAIEPLYARAAGRGLDAFLGKGAKNSGDEAKASGDANRPGQSSQG